MATILDKVYVTTVTTGTGCLINLSTVVTGFQSFANAGAVNNAIFSYGINDTANTWEVGVGTFITNASGQFVLVANSTGGTTGNRQPQFSSNSGTGPLNLSGTAALYATLLASDYNTLTPANSIIVGANTVINSSMVTASSVNAIAVDAALSVNTLAVTAANVFANNLYSNGSFVSNTTGNVSTYQDAYGFHYIANTQSPALTTSSALMSNVADQGPITGGVWITSYQYANNENVAMDVGKGPLQYYYNNAAFSITSPAFFDGSCLLMIINGPSAGAITFEGFVVGADTGDALDTIEGHIFTISVWTINGTSGYRIAAHQ